MLNFRDTNNCLRAKFHVKRFDVAPFTGWLYPSHRSDLYDVMNEMGCYKKGVEVGVNVARNALDMLMRIKDLHLTCIDPWEKYGRHTQEKIDSCYEKAKNKLTPFLSDQVKIIRKKSMDALMDIPDKSVDFIYVDGLHDFDSIITDLVFWARKVRHNGIIAGHDYYQFYKGGVVTAVDAYTKAHNIHEWYITREEKASWFWVKK